MPRDYSSDEEERKDDGKGPSSRDNGITKRSRNEKEDESRRALRWVSYTKPRVVFGFDHLTPAYVPAMSNKTCGYSVCFEKVIGFRPPIEVLNELDQGGIEISVQLSMSLFHLNSVSFFGTTWMGSPVPLSSDGRTVSDVVDFDSNEVVYFMSRLTDSSCVGVLEVVASKVDSDTGVVLSQYGCGWTMLNLFAQNPSPADISEGHQNVQLTVSNLWYLPDCILHMYVPLYLHILLISTN